MENERGSLTESARGLTERLRNDGRAQIETRKRQAADQIDEVAYALSQASEQLGSQPTLAGYATQIADGVGKLATRLRDGSIEQLIDDTRGIARRNPGLFILGSFVTGIALARFLKASERSLSETASSQLTGESGDFSSDFATASTSQDEYPSRDYSPSMSTSEQPYNDPRSGV